MTRLLVQALEYDDEGRPSLLRVLYAADVVDLKGGEQFLTLQPEKPEAWRADPANAARAKES